MKAKPTTSPTRFLSVCRLVLVSVGLAFGLGATGSVIAAGTAAGQVITNQAQATFQDANGNTYNSSSNDAFITVAKVFNSTITPDDLGNTGAVSQTLDFVHVLSNLGNGVDTYTVTIAQDAAGQTDQADFDNLRVCEDLNNNGTLDGGEIPGSGTENCATTAGSINVTLNGAGATTTRNLIVQGTVPGAGVVNGDRLLSTLLVTSTGGTVDDPQAANGLDAVESTNNDEVIVSGDAVLTILKTATALDANTIEYTVRISNNGNAPAYNVELQDAPLASEHNLTTLAITNVVGNYADDSLNPAEGTALDWTRDTANGGANLCEVATTGCATAALGVSGSGPVITDDPNGDGTPDIGAGTDAGIRAHDDVLLPTNFIEVTFTVDVAVGLAAGTVIDNTANFRADNNDDGDAIDTGETGSSATTVVAPQNYAVQAEDTFLTTPADDADATDNDVQSVNNATSGGTVTFRNDIYNNGNGTDAFDLTIANTQTAIDNARNTAIAPGNTNTGIDAECSALPTLDLAPECRPFPATTVFTFTDQFGTPLNDTVGSAPVDITGVAAGTSRRIRVNATLPATATVDAFSDNSTPLDLTDDYSIDYGGDGPGGGNDIAYRFMAIVTATSVGDPAAIKASDIKAESLMYIVPAGVDLNNGATADTVVTTDADAFALSPAAPSAPTTTLTGNLGQQLAFELNVQNDGGVPESFALNAGSTWNGTVLGALHTGWTVGFFSDGTCTTSIGSSTASLAGGSAAKVWACVTIPTNPSQALAEAGTFNVNGTGAVTVNTNDTDGDYPIVFRVVGNNSGVIDVKLDAVDVNAFEDVSLVTDGSGNVQPGGSIDYPHTLTNQGNTTELLSLTAVNGNASFTNSRLIDTDCVGGPDTAFSTLVVGSNVCVSGVVETLVDVDTVTAGNQPGFSLAPGESVDFAVRVFAASGTAQGSIDNLTLTATYNIGNVDGVETPITNTDTTTVVVGNVQLKKMVALDAGCDGIPDEAFNDPGFGGGSSSATSQAAPGQCVVYRIVANNNGTQNARNVVINDAAPPTFTAYQSSPTPPGGTMFACRGNAGAAIAPTGCTTPAGAFDPITDTNTGDDATENGASSEIGGSTDGSGNVTWRLNNVFAVGPPAIVGVLAPAANVTVQFTVQVQ